MSSPKVILLSGVTLVVLAVVACSTNDGRPCSPGDYRYCACPTPARGYAQCLDDGSAYGACDCSGEVPAGAGILVEAGVPDAAAPEEAGAAIGFLEPCTEDEQCGTKLCFGFNAYGPHCSHSCTKDLDCEAPSPGCNNMKVCKLH